MLRSENINCNWHKKTLGEILKVRHGKSQHEIQDLNGKYPILATGGQIGWGNEFLYDKPSVLIGRKGTIDKPQYFCEPFWTIDTLFYTEITDGYDPKYIYYLFNMIDWYLYNEASGVPSLNSKTIESIEICLPSFNEQRMISEALSNADNLLQSLEKLIDKKKKIKQGTMQQLLTGKKRLPGFSGEWEIEKINKLVWYQEGPGVRTSQFRKDGIKLLNGTNINNGKIILETTDRYISKETAFGEYKHFLADEGDIIIACSGISIDRFDEKVSVLKAIHLPLCMNTSTMRFKIISTDILDKIYFMYFLKSNDFKTQISGKATGSAQLNFGPSHVNKVRITFPDIQEQKAIADVLTDMDSEIESLEHKLEKYKKIKQGMMQELLTGRIRLI